MNTMKQYLLLLVAGIMLTACSTEENFDDNYTQNANSTEVVGIPYASYNADWVINREVIDHTIFEYGGFIQITHFPNSLLLDWTNEEKETEDRSDNYFDFNKVGNTSQQLYFNSTALSSYQIDINGICHVVHLECQDGSPTAVYDQKADRWMITWQLTGVTLTNSETGQSQSHTYSTVKAMMLVTTKRAE